MNRLSYFRSLEADQARGDSREGIDYVYQPGGCEFVLDTGIPGVEKIRGSEASGLAGVRIRMQRTASCKIFCMFAVTRPVEGPLFPSSRKWFGDSLVFPTALFGDLHGADPVHQGRRGARQQVRGGAFRILIWG
jgi:hypothetical protein